jgi:hypothetical protein
MSLTFLEAQNAALHDDFNPTKYRDRVKRWINEATSRVYRLVNLTETESESVVNVLAGTNTYALPTNKGRVESLRSTQFGELEQVGIDDFDAMSLNVTAGRPLYYVLRGSSILLYPTPNTNLTLMLRYERLPSALVNDADLVPLPTDYEFMPVYYARMRLHEAEGDLAMAQAQREAFFADLRELRAVQVRSDSHRQIPGHWSGVEAVGPRITPPPSWS